AQGECSSDRAQWPGVEHWPDSPREAGTEIAIRIRVDIPRAEIHDAPCRRRRRHAVETKFGYPEAAALRSGLPAPTEVWLRLGGTIRLGKAWRRPHEREDY